MAADGAEVSGDFRVRKRSNAPLIIVIVVIVGVGVIGLMASLPGGGGKPPEKTQEIVSKVDREEEARARQEKLAQEALEGAEKVRAEYPEHFENNIYNFRGVAQSYPGTASGAKAQERQLQLQDEWRVKAREKLEALKSEIDALNQGEKFIEARALVEEIPPALVGSDLITEFRNLRIDARMQAVAIERFSELERKAYQRLEQNEEDIALHVLNELPKKYEEDAPVVWEKKERTLRQIKRDGTEGFIKRMKEQAADQAKAEEERIAAERVARENRWNEMLDKVNWSDQINEASDYNWVVNSDGRRGAERPEWKFAGGVWKANNTFGHAMYKGIFTNFWQDYALRFEMRIVKGSLKISPRSQYRVNSGSITTQSSPLVELKTDDFGTSWVPVTMYVRGETVELFKGRDTTLAKILERAYEGENDSLPTEGGFIFWVDDGSYVEFKNVETKLVSHARKRLF